MTIVFPIASGDRLVGSATLIGHHKQRLFFATALHLFGESKQISVVIPGHGGDLRQPQIYPPAPEFRVWHMAVVATNPFADLAVLATPAHPDLKAPPIKISDAPYSLLVGAEAVVLGYPFAPIGSILETWTPATVTAHAKRQLAPGLAIEELVLSAVSHPGSSGSAVVGRDDGVIHGILRGALAPPEVLKIGDIPIATDTSVTFATSAHLLGELLTFAKHTIDSIP